MHNRNSLSVVTLNRSRDEAAQLVTAITLGAVNDTWNEHVTLVVHDMTEVKHVARLWPPNSDHVMELGNKLTVVTWDAFTWAMVTDMFIMVDPSPAAMLGAPQSPHPRMCNHATLVMDDDGGLTLMSVEAIVVDMVEITVVDITDVSAGL